MGSSPAADAQEEDYEITTHSDLSFSTCSRSKFMHPVFSHEVTAAYLLEYGNDSSMMFRIETIDQKVKLSFE